jgi:hypothetical protein
VISIAQSAIGRTWQSARCVILVFLRRRSLLGRRTPVFFRRKALALLAIYRQQPGHHLPSNSQRCSIGVPLLAFFFMNESQIMVLFRRQLRGFDEHTLDMLVALFGKWCAHHLFRGALFVTAEPAITDGLSNRPKTRNISHLQSPGQRSDGSNSGNAPQPLDSVGQQGSRCSELTKAYSVFCRRTMVSRLSRNNGRMLS